MTKKSNLLILSLLASIGLFIYLTFHHFALKLGLGGSSLCHISSKINCDAAATSSFAELAGIPVAILGGVFHIILLLFVIFYRFGWSEPTSYLRVTLRGMLISSVAVAVIFGSISLFILKILCPFCIATYVFSLINLFLGWNLVQNYSKDTFRFSNYFNEYKSHLIVLITIPITSWVVSGMIQSNYGLDQLKKQIPEKIAIWNAGTQFSFDKSIGISNKVENPRMTIVEFADFKCSHCKYAAATFETFLSNKPDIEFIYKPFPLDGSCNDGIPQKGDGSRCVLAAFTLCADKLAQKGLDMYHWIFHRQEKLINISDVKSLLPEIQADLGLDSAQMSECADSSEIYDQLKKSAAEGAAAQVEGTPAVYLNGKKLPWGHQLEMLKQVTQ